MKQARALVLSNIEVAAGIRLLQLRAPDIAASAEPGQFIHVRCSDSLDPLLRRPLSVHRIGRLAPSYGKDQIAVLFQVVGRGTAGLATRRPGDMIDALGPAGRGFTLRPSTRRLLLVGGGMGIAPLVAAADLAISREIAVTVLAGARTADQLLPAQLLPREAEYAVSTEDGSLGFRGVVSDLMPEFLAWADQVFVCGPRGMLEAVGAIVRGRSVAVQVSLEQRMACGVGACLGCVVDTRRGPRRVCRDGPVFSLEELTLP